MNLYKYYNGDSLLDNEMNAFDKIPKYFWKRLIRTPNELIKREKYIALDPYYALHYAIGIKRGPFPEGEAAIATNPEYAVEYASMILKSRFKLAEPIILKYPYQLLEYMNMLEDRWLEGEDVLKDDPKYWYRYKYKKELNKSRIK